MNLEEYEKKRDFSKTSEPTKEEEVAEIEHPAFVIQEHHASHLHWDFRLEMDEVLKSWAIPKGIPEKKGQKRLAVRTEDHPIGYLTFEGEIPEGQYGAGTVKIYDMGTYELKEREKEKIEFELHGRKIKGKYVLVRFTGKEKNWLIIKVS